MTSARPAVSNAQRRDRLVERHLLDERSRSERSVGDVASALGLLHSTDPAVPHLSIHARSDATVDDIDAAFYDERSLLRITTLRRTVFAMPPADALAALGAFNTGLAAKLEKQLIGWLNDEGHDGTDVFAHAIEDVVTHLSENGPSTGNELSKALPVLHIQVQPKASPKPFRITSKVLEILGTSATIIRGRPNGSMTSGAWTWVAATDWLDSPLEIPSESDALASLMRRYLSTMGPATVTDAAWWTGIGKTKIRAALEAIDAVEVTLEDIDEPGFVLPGDPLATGTSATAENRSDDAARVALLPGLDPTTMGWKLRDWYVDDSVATGLFDRNGNAGPTIWIDGHVVGAWTQQPDGTIATDELPEITSDIAAAIDSEAERTAAWLNDVRIRWRYPTPCTKQLDS